MGKGFLLTASSEAANQPAGSFTVSMPRPLALQRNIDYEIGLVFYSVYFTIQNIFKGVNDKFSVTNTNTSISQTITIPPGNYTIEAIIAFISSALAGGTFGDDTVAVLTIDESTQTTSWTLKQYFQVNLTLSQFNVILGFNSELVPTGGAPADGSVYESENEANVAFGFSAFTVSCNAVHPDFSLSTTNTTAGTSQAQMKTSTILYSSSFFQPNGQQQAVNIGPANAIFLPVIDGFKGNSELQVVLQDQSGNILDFSQSGNYTNNPSYFQFYIREA